MPNDPSQVIYVWFDALANYITALDYGREGTDYATWWHGADERVHVIGKGIVRFHAVYWPAILLSAGEPLPTTVFVHDYITVGGEKLSKSRATTSDPVELAGRYGVDALRWWFLRDVLRAGDVDFHEERLVARANELADDLGNLVNRTITLVNRLRPDRIDVTASPLHRVLGLARLTVGTGRSDRKDNGVHLDALTSAEADRLRVELLRMAAEDQLGRLRLTPGASNPERTRELLATDQANLARLREIVRASGWPGRGSPAGPPGGCSGARRGPSSQPAGWR